MSIQELTLAGGLLLAALTLIEITPLKINPWSALAKAIGRAVNAELLQSLQQLREQITETREKLEQHIAETEARQADASRAAILQFNHELLLGRDHTQEEYENILEQVDRYERYCRDHPDYPNSRAVHATANIRRVYDIRLQKRDFADPAGAGE